MSFFSYSISVSFMYIDTDREGGRYSLLSYKSSFCISDFCVSEYVTEYFLRMMIDYNLLVLIAQHFWRISLKLPVVIFYFVKNSIYVLIIAHPLSSKYKCSDFMVPNKLWENQLKLLLPTAKTCCIDGYFTHHSSRCKRFG